MSNKFSQRTKLNVRTSQCAYNKIIFFWFKSYFLHINPISQHAIYFYNDLSKFLIHFITYTHSILIICQTGPCRGIWIRFVKFHYAIWLVLRREKNDQLYFGLNDENQIKKRERKSQLGMSNLFDVHFSFFFSLNLSSSLFIWYSY